MKKIYINGRFLTQKITGVQRFATEIVKKLENSDEVEFIILAPKKSELINKEIDNIKIIQTGFFNGHLWDQISFVNYVKKNNGIPLTLSGLCPILFPGYWVIHDVNFKIFKKSYKKTFRLIYNFVTKFSINRTKALFTVSDFSKSEILGKFNCKKQFTIVYNSANHMNLNKDDKVLSKWGIEKHKYNFTVGSKNLHKNQSYIYEMAKINPDELFVISGNKSNSFSNVKHESLSNVLEIGYTSTEELSALYANAKRFIFPSFYEGFGIPPLEAIFLGCTEIYLSDILVFHEIYGDVANYFNPHTPFILDNIAPRVITESERKTIIEKYSWDENAKRLIEIIEK